MCKNNSKREYIERRMECQLKNFAYTKHVAVIKQALLENKMVYYFEAIFTSRGFCVYKERTWTTAKVGDEVKV